MPASLTPVAKLLRKNATDAERALWKYLRAKQLDGYKFRRQQPVGDFVVDFVCFERKLIVELDGGQHAEHGDADRARTGWLETQGFTVIRFWNDEVLRNMDGVWQVIADRLPTI